MGRRGGWGVAPTLRSGLTSECTLGTGGGGSKSMGGVPEGGPLGVHVQGRSDPEEGVTALAGEGGEPTAHCGEGGGEERGG